jgi:LacI family transcriptional regulator
MSKGILRPANTRSVGGVIKGPNRVDGARRAKERRRRQGREIDSEGIAKLVGVSRSTVSKVLNGYPHIAQATRERVLRAVRQYQYYPNFSAQVLAGKTTDTLGLFFINQGHFSEDVLANYLISSIIENAASLGYHTLSYLIRNPEDPATAGSIKEVFCQRRICAGIFIGARNHEAVVEELISEGFIVGIFDQDLPGRAEPNRIVVNFEDERTARAAIEYLCRLGHRDIAVIHGDLRRNAGAAKHRGFMGALAEQGVAARDEWTMYGDFNSEGGLRVMRNLLRSGRALPSTIAAVNDNTAFGAMQAITEAGLRIPEDISIVGIDGHPLCGYSRPPLTTFEFDFQAMMRGLISTVIGVVESDDQSDHLRQVFPSHLVERSSCRGR